MNIKQFESLEESINKELLRRGLPPVKLTLTETSKGNKYLTAESEEFNTTPVIFESCKITHFNSILEERNGVIWVEMSLVFECLHFDGGTTGVGLLQIKARVKDENTSVDIKSYS